MNYEAKVSVLRDEIERLRRLNQRLENGLGAEDLVRQNAETILCLTLALDKLR